MFFQELAQKLDSVENKEELNKLKIELTRKYKLKKTPRNIEILCHLPKKTLQQHKSMFITKPTRTISGVAPIAIMTMPFACPTQAQCTYCPGGPDSFFGDTPKSYPGGSPAHLRAERNFYDAYLQVFNRLEHYTLTNNNHSKVELIIMGGTFPTYPLAYRTEFVTYAFKAMNDFSDMFFVDGELDFEKFKEFFELPTDVKDVARTERIHKKLLALKGKSSLEAEHARNEVSHIRCVTLVIESRPDCSNPVHIDDMLRLGTTRAEIGVQSIYDDVMLRTKRGHGDAENIKATQMLKDSFLKVGYHAMLGLPLSSRERDITMFKEFFTNQNYMPDALKMYPCLVFKGTELYDEWKQGKFKPIDTAEAADRIAEIKQHIPKWCRVMRVQRDIPSTLTQDGVASTNLRQYVEQQTKKKGIVCQCIRCREPKLREVSWDHVKYLKTNYEASQGQEVFLSAEDVKNNLLLGFLRLRIPYKPFRPEITEKTAGVREIHTYGNAIRINEQDENAVQHRGVGKTLMAQAEEVAKNEFDMKQLMVIAGVGVRPYFFKLGYKRCGPYVTKQL